MASSSTEMSIMPIPPSPTALVTHAQKVILDAAHVGLVGVIKTIGTNYQYLIQNTGSVAWPVTSVVGTTYSLLPATHTFIADTVKDGLVSEYGATPDGILEIVGSSEDYSAPIYKRITTSTTWTLVDLGSYSGRFFLNNIDPIDTIYVSFSGFYATTGALSIEVNATTKSFIRTTGSFLNDGFYVGGTITTTGFADAGNNSTFIVSAVTALQITCSTAVGLVTKAAATGKTVVSSAPPPGYVFTLHKTGLAYSHQVELDRTMNPERYILVKSSANTPILEVLGT